MDCLGCGILDDRRECWYNEDYCSKECLIKDEQWAKHLELDPECDCTFEEFIDWNQNIVMT